MEQYDKLERLIARAEKLEHEDRHVSESSRIRIVRLTEKLIDELGLSFQKSYYPYEESITNRFIHIVYDF